jgi:hypothetical protein
MELILRLLTKRNFLIAAAVIAALLLGDRFRAYPVLWYEHWRYPPQMPDRASAADIVAAQNALESLKLRALHQRVSAEISSAAESGLDVGTLQAQADALLALDTPKYREVAIEKLNRLSLSIPQPVEHVTPAGEDDEPPADEVPTPTASPVRRR